MEVGMPCGAHEFYCFGRGFDKKRLAVPAFFNAAVPYQNGVRIFYADFQFCFGIEDKAAVGERVRAYACKGKNPRFWVY